MKQAIECLKCGAYSKTQIGRYPYEDVRVSHGRSDFDVVCDICAKPIRRGERCFAVSISTPGTPYHEWETNFITLEVEPVADDGRGVT
jgi:hypothetical protein